MSEEAVENQTVIEKKIPKKVKRKEKKLEKLRKKLLNPVDIKYHGPLSYRWLRIIAWLAFVVGQVVVLNTLSSKFFDNNFLGNASYVFQFIPQLATPLFIIASFGRILDGKRSFKYTIMFYGAAFLGIGLGFSLFYARYVEGLLLKIGVDSTFADLLGQLIGKRAEVNVFADLFFFVLFHFFINYTPNKIFTGKKIYIFRSLCVIPVAYIITSYVFKVLGGLNLLDLPFYIYPFLATKSPLVFLIFVIVSIWIKNRERLFLKLGASRDEYKEFLLTNRNSLSFSVNLSIIIVVFIFVDFFVSAASFITLAVTIEGTEQITQFLTILGGGQCASLVFVIPFILLYSYTRTHKNQLIDLFIPVIGIALCVLVYIEGAYQMIVQLI